MRVSRYLKGNYPLPEKDASQETQRQKDPTASEQFERRALERLGGSIAFVLKKKTFVWKGGDSSPDAKG